jgi:NAD+ synthase
MKMGLKVKHGASLPFELPEILRINAPLTARLLVQFLREETRKTGLKKAVLGLSGGIDSALVAALATKALGAKNVLGIMMPYKTSASSSLNDAKAVAASLAMPVMTQPITTQVDSYFRHFPEAGSLRRGNKMARERMSILYDQSAVFSALVLGTSNKTELLLGYGTLHGDLASALNPLGDLYKTQVRQLALHMKLPDCVIRKAPSADLWAGQTDEQELGFAYENVDLLLYHLIDCRYDDSELILQGYSKSMIRQVRSKIQNSQYKRRMPLIAKISGRTIGREFRYPRDWGL